MHRSDLNAIPVFLKLMEKRSFRAVAAETGLSHPTIKRRIEDMEEALGKQLFLRHREGVTPTEAARELAPLAESVLESMLRFNRVAAKSVDTMSGPITLSLPPWVGPVLTTGLLLKFVRAWPALKLEVKVDRNLVRLDQLEADMVIRAVPNGISAGDDLVGRKLGNLEHAVYGKPPFWIGAHASDHAPPAELLEGVEIADRQRASFSEIEMRFEVCRKGLGMGLFPCAMAEGVLPRHSQRRMTHELWILVHPDLRDDPRLKALRDDCVAHFADVLRPTNRMASKIQRPAQGC